jgi:hypothetical protein
MLRFQLGHLRKMRLVELKASSADIGKERRRETEEEKAGSAIGASDRFAIARRICPSRLPQ